MSSTHDHQPTVGSNSAQPLSDETSGQHDHDHDHAHQQSGQLNAELFDKRVAAPENATKADWQRYYEAFSVELVERRAWMGLTRAPAKAGSDGDAQPVRMLDYACGGGHASRTLLPYLDEAVGVDVSGRSVAAFNAWAAANGAGACMRAVQANVMTDEGRAALADARYFGFDLVVCIMALHHFVDARLAVARLAERLRPGGRLVVVDWNRDGYLGWAPEERHETAHTIHAKGFGEEDMRRLFEAAGLEDCDYREVLSFTEAGVTAMSRGTKPLDK